VSAIAVGLCPFAVAQTLACPKTVPVNPKPNWFAGSGTVTVSVAIQPSDIGCTGKPAEVRVPNNQTVRLHVTYPNNYACSTTLEESKPGSQNPAQDLITAFSKLGVFGYDFVKSTPIPDKEFDRALPPLKNTVMTAAVQCKASDGSKPTPGDQNQPVLIQKIAITYQNPPRVTASAGFVLAPGVKSYGVKTTNTGTGSGGVINVRNTVAVTGSPSAQVVPFAFANVYLIGSPKTHIDAQFGFGVNPNLSTAKPEFFASPFAFSWHDVYLSPGVHIGQHEEVMNGFALGDVLPNGVKVPVKFKYFAGFGFSVSYNLHPLVTGKSGS